MQYARIFWVSLVLFLATGFMNFTCLAETGAPNVLNYQGTLEDDAGELVTGLKTMVFRIYDSISAAPENALWESGDVEVAVQDGHFSLNLGESPQPAFPEDLFHDDTRFLGVTVDGSELIERKRLVSVPYALNAGSGIPAGGIIMWSGNAAEVPEGWALCDGQNGTPDLRDRFVVGAGSTYSSGQTGGSKTKDLSHTHTGPSHTHSIPNHKHYCNWTIGPYPGGNDYDDEVADGRDDTPAGSDHQHRIQKYTDDAGAGSTGASGTGNTGTGGSASQDIMPPYYALCFIMKL